MEEPPVGSHGSGGDTDPDISVILTASQLPATGRLRPIEGGVGPDLGFRRGAIGPGIWPRGATEGDGRPGSRVAMCWDS